MARNTWQEFRSTPLFPNCRLEEPMDLKDNHIFSPECKLSKTNIHSTLCRRSPTQAGIPPGPLKAFKSIKSFATPAASVSKFGNTRVPFKGFCRPVFVHMLTWMKVPQFSGDYLHRIALDVATGEGPHKWQRIHLCSTC